MMDETREIAKTTPKAEEYAEQAKGIIEKMDRTRAQFFSLVAAYSVIKDLEKKGMSPQEARNASLKFYGQLREHVQQIEEPKELYYDKSVYRGKDPESMSAEELAIVDARAILPLVRDRAGGGSEWYLLFITEALSGQNQNEKDFFANLPVISQLRGRPESLAAITKEVESRTERTLKDVGLPEEAIDFVTSRLS